jgi:hypothetical protein
MNITDIVSVAPATSEGEIGGWRQIWRDFVALIILGWRTGAFSRRGSTSGRSNRSAIPLLLIGGIVLILLGAGAGSGMGIAARFLGLGALASLLDWESLLIFALLFMTAIPSVLRAYTEQSDLRLLLTTPASPIAVFAARFCIAIMGNEFLIGCLALPATISLGVVLHMAPLYYVLAVILVLLLPVLPVGLATVVVFLLLRVIPAARARNLTTILASFSGIAFYIVSRFLFFGSFSATGATAEPRILTLPTYNWFAWLPMNWAANALLAAVRPAWGSAIAVTVLTLALSVAIIGIVVWSAEHLFGVGWLNYQETPRRRARRNAALAITAAPAGAPLTPIVGSAGAIAPAGVAARSTAETPGAATSTGALAENSAGALAAAAAARPAAPQWSLMRTEWRTLLRDPQLIAIVGPRIFSGAIIVFAFVGGTHSAFSGFGPVGLILAMSLYAYFFFGAMGMLALTRELGGLRAVLMTAISTAQVLQAKFLAVLTPILLVLEVVQVILGLILRMTAVQIVIIVVGLLPISIALLALAMLAILLFPGQPGQQNLNMRRVWPSAQAALLGSLGGLILMAVVAGTTIGGLLLLTLTTLWWLAIVLLLVAPLGAIALGVMLFRRGPDLLERMAFVRSF